MNMINLFNRISFKGVYDDRYNSLTYKIFQAIYGFRELISEISIPDLDETLLSQFIYEYRGSIFSKNSSSSGIFDMNGGIVVDIKHTYATIMYNNSSSIKKLKEIREKFEKMKIKPCGKIHLISRSRNELALTEFPIKKLDIDLMGHYNEDFKSFDESIIKWINDDTSGISILHGEPGTGKTSYVKNLCYSTDKRFIYIPPDMSAIISSPEFISFLKDYPSSILLIEDAENVLKPRLGSQNQAVSNLLNISDGILSDCLKLKIICTFNTSISNVDEALLRKGRLKSRYEFGKLSKDRVKALTEKHNLPMIDSDSTLAEIFNPDAIVNKKKERSSIGFSFSNQ